MSHSQPLLNPTGGVDDRRCVTQPALHDDLMARVLDHVNLQRAWKRVKGLCPSSCAKKIMVEVERIF